MPLTTSNPEPTVHLYSLCRNTVEKINNLMPDSLFQSEKEIIESLAVQIKLTYLAVFSVNHDFFSPLLVWRKNGRGKFPLENEVFRIDRFPWLSEKLRENRLFKVSDSNTSFLLSQSEKELFAGSGLSGMNVLPFFVKKKPLGFLIYDASEEQSNLRDNILFFLGNSLFSRFGTNSLKNDVLLGENRFEELINNLDEVFFLANEHFSRFFFASEVFEEIWHRPVSEIYADSKVWIKDVVQDDKAKIDLFLKKITSSHKTRQIEFRIQVPDERIKWILFKVFPVKNLQNQVYRYAAIATDISEKKTSERALMRAHDKEIEIGAKIQTDLLLGEPDALPEGLSSAQYSLPSRMIDGDFYNFFTLSKDTVDFIIGDVMGKGISAALLGAAANMAITKGLYKTSMSFRKSLPPIKSILIQLCRSFTPNLIHLESFITLYYCRYMNQGFLHFIDCGHPPFLLYDSREETVWKIKGVNFPLGFTHNQHFRDFFLPVRQNDLLLFYSDGISEVINDEEEQFGVRRLEYLLKNYRALPLDDIIKKIVDLAFQYSLGGFQDDVTIILFRVNELKDTEVLLLDKSYSGDAGFIEQAKSDIKEPLRSLLTEEKTNSVLLALHELFINIYEHSDFKEQTISFRAEQKSKKITMTVLYSGEEFSWFRADLPDINAYPENGYGLYILQKVFDSVLFCFDSKKRVKVCLILEK